MGCQRANGVAAALPLAVAGALLLALALGVPTALATPPPSRPSKRVCPGPVREAAACHARVVTNGSGTPRTTSGPSGYGPAQFHGAYQLPVSAPLPQTIAIVDAYDDPTIEGDLAVYDEAYGLPPCTTANGCFRKVNQKGEAGAYPKADGGWALEIALDVETAHAICQNCEILLVEASSNLFSDLTAAVNTAASLGADEISNSYGGPEYAGELGDSSYNHPGIALTVSAGDDGYAAEYPASSPYVVAVGGTTLTLGSSNSYGSEAVWSGSGSGCSAYVGAPSWQTADANWALTGCGSKRAVADVAADANPSTGASVYDTTKYQGQSGWFVLGGTSLSAPLIAAVYALAGGPTSAYPAAEPYGHQGDSPPSLHDVSSGSNGACGTIMCKGALGYDGPSGVGTPKGVLAFGEGGDDTTPPQTTIGSGPAGPTNDPTPTFAFASNEPGSSFECQLDSAGFSGCSSPLTTPPLDDGPHSFEVRATDEAGNTGLPASRSFSVDTEAPQIDLTAPAAGSFSSTATPELAGTAGIAPGDSGTVSVKVYAGTGTGGTLLQTRSATRDPATGAYSVAAASLASGTYTAQASQADSAGNSALSAPRTFSVDVTAPTSQASSPASANSTSIAVEYTASDAHSGLASVELWAKPAGAGSYEKVATDDAPGASGSFSYSAAADGSYSFYTRARDAAGNYESAPGSADSTTLLDTTPPQTTIDSGPGGSTDDPTPTFAFSSNEPGSSFECRLDSAGFSGCSSPLTTAPLDDGPHSFEVRATDAVGNVGTAAARAFTVDAALEEEETPGEEPTGEDTSPPESSPPETTPLTNLELPTPPVPLPQSLRLGRAKVDADGISATLTVRVSGPGRLVLLGRRVRRVRREVSAAGRFALRVRLRKRFIDTPAPASVTVTYTPGQGTPISKETTVPFG
jgi:Big-like domain-containing protein